jgi:hypothetical protein
MSLIGTRVIVRSNEVEPLKVGTLVGFSKFGVPLVHVEDKKYMCCGAVIPYDVSMEMMLNSLTPEGQWKLLSTMLRFHEKLTWKCAEMIEGD